MRYIGCDKLINQIQMLFLKYILWLVLYISDLLQIKIWKSDYNLFTPWSLIKYNVSIDTFTVYGDRP